jgi:cytochrome b
MDEQPPLPVRVWDLPVRVFHWLLVALITTSVTTGLVGGNLMVWHMRSGYTILTLVAFRMAWGAFGSTTARFTDFLYGPRRVIAFAKDLYWRRPAHYLGHNPLGGWMVLVLLLALLFQAGSGLFANDDISTEGPLYRFVSKDLSDTLTRLHKLNIKFLYGLVALHVAAVIYHWLARGENLVRAMFTGVKAWPSGAPASTLRFSSLWFALGLFTAASLAVWLLVSQPASQSY